MLAADINDIGVSIVRSMLEAIFGFGFVVFVFGIGTLIGMVALITWIVKKIWYSGEEKTKKPKRTTVPNDGFQGNREENVKWYPTGWTFNEKTKLWEPPDYVSKESSEKWEWDPGKKIWIDKEKEARLEKYRKYHEGQPPTFEEWKAQREKEKNDESTS